jgi:NTP pyrophosphatase (non-canonical NTP hydrolase)
MIFQDYIPLARATVKELPYHQHLVHMGMGVFGEWGEIIDAIKKFTIYGKGVGPEGQPMLVADGGMLDLVNMAEEIGDVAWYLACYSEELGASPAIVQTSFDAGIQQGTTIRPQITDNMELANFTLVLACGAGALVGKILTVTGPGNMTGVQALAGLANTLGTLCGLFGIDGPLALERNIAKLKKRYGDKFSSHAAINRDLAGERAVLEGKAG